MGLSAALPALLGTILGALVTLLADRVRWRRDLALRSHEARRAAMRTAMSRDIGSAPSA